MARSKKKARHIIVEGVAFSWRAAGDDGCITLTIWPDTLVGPSICAHFGYHETWIPRGGDTYSSAGDQIVVTNRLVRRVILQAIEKFAYDPTRKGKLIRIPQVDKLINVDDAVRACKPRRTGVRTSFLQGLVENGKGERKRGHYYFSA